MSAFQIDDDGRTARIDKGVDESLTYRFDLSALLGAANVASVALTVDPALTLVGQGNDAKTVSVQIAGGALGRFHALKCDVTTDETPPQEYSRTMVFRIVP